MQRSQDRILTTHVGSLARPRALLDLMARRNRGEPVDPETFEAEARSAVHDVVTRQVECGIDIVTDGEQSKTGFFSYVAERLAGHSPAPPSGGLPPSWMPEIEAFREYYDEYLKRHLSTSVQPLGALRCDAPVHYAGHADVRRDIDNLKSAAADAGAFEAFLPSTAPRAFGSNEYYPSTEEYLQAVAEALREEYLAIVEAGLVLQIDDPQLVDLLSDDGRTDETERHRRAEAHIELVNHALRGIPEESIRHHTCYGLNHGPRIHDMPMEKVAPFLLKVRAGAYSFEFANPRHQHEWRIWKDIRLPDGKVLIPGFIGHAQNYVEHPELIAEGIVRFAEVVGRENLIAGADCGFSSQAMYSTEVHRDIVWAKFEALAEGARLASVRLGF